jgi:diketogulonate reductase-like aldo/keto reductase
MARWTIGGHEVHPIGIGTWGMGGDRLPDGNPYADYRNDERDAEAIRYAIAQGQNHIDTAQLYGAGHTEEIVGEAISGFDREKLFIATKVWRTHSLRNAVPKAAEESARKLGIDSIDLLYVHAPWDAIPMEEYIGGLNDAVDAGLAKAIAVSNFTVADLERAISLSRHRIVANQVHYNLLHRGLVDERMRGLCSQHGIAIVAYRPVERRRLADHAESKIVLDTAADLGCTPAQLAIAWLVSQPGVVTIPKASTPDHIDENLGAMHVSIPEQVRARLDASLGTI